jgi:hypothetical protein
VVAIDVVTADGRHRRVDAEHEPDPFWALRGGGGSFAVVTALEFTCFPINEVHAGVLCWPIKAAREVLHVWRQLLSTLPDSVTSVGRLLRFPPLPDLPPHLRGRSYVVVEAACQNSPDEVDALLGPVSDATASAGPPATRPRRWPPDVRYAHKTDGYTVTASAARGPSSCSGRCPSDLPGGAGRPRWRSPGHAQRGGRPTVEGDIVRHITLTALASRGSCGLRSGRGRGRLRVRRRAGRARPRRHADLEAHERRHFDGGPACSRSTRLIALCSPCHLVTHFGYANVQGRTDEALGTCARSTASRLPRRSRTSMLPRTCGSHNRRACGTWI